MLKGRKVAALVAASASALALTAAPASADPTATKTATTTASTGIRVIAEGLNGPRQLSRAGGRLLVTEADAGQVTRVRIRTGATRPVLTGLGEGVPTGAIRVGKRYVFLTGEAEPGVPAPPQTLEDNLVYVARAGRTPRQLVDLEDYERAVNPDGQDQFNDAGQPLDALVNPFYILKDRYRSGYLVAAAGGNAVLRVSRTGRVSTFFVPPVVTTGVCAGRPNNDPQHTGCDPVPTGLAYGPGKTLYVSTLSGEAPNEGRVYVLNARTGRVRHVLTGFSGPTGVAVDRRTGTVYVSELLEGAPAEEPGPGFDPTTVGQIVRVSPRGRRTYAQVTMPSGLLFTRGHLYASAWSIAGFLGIADAGQVVRVSRRAFQPATAASTRAAKQDGPAALEWLADR